MSTLSREDIRNTIIEYLTTVPMDFSPRSLLAFARHQGMNTQDFSSVLTEMMHCGDVDYRYDHKVKISEALSATLV